MNTDRSNKAGKHWWSTLDIDLKSDFLLFDSFRVEGLKNFIIQDNKKIVEKVIKGIEKIERKDNKLTQVRLRFLVKNFRELKDNKNYHCLRTLLGTKARQSKHVDVGRPHTKTKNRDLWTIPNLLLRQSFFFSTRIASYSHTKADKTSYRNVAKRNIFVRQRTKRESRKRIHKTKGHKNDMTSSKWLACPE